MGSSERRRRRCAARQRVVRCPACGRGARGVHPLVPGQEERTAPRGLAGRPAAGAAGAAAPGTGGAGRPGGSRAPRPPPRSQAPRPPASPRRHPQPCCRCPRRRRRFLGFRCPRHSAERHHAGLTAQRVLVDVAAAGGTLASEPSTAGPAAFLAPAPGPAPRPGSTQRARQAAPGAVCGAPGPHPHPSPRRQGPGASPPPHLPTLGRAVSPAWTAVCGTAAGACRRATPPPQPQAPHRHAAACGRADRTAQSPPRTLALCSVQCLVRHAGVLHAAASQAPQHHAPPCGNPHPCYPGLRPCRRHPRCRCPVPPGLPPAPALPAARHAALLVHLAPCPWRLGRSAGGPVPYRGSCWWPLGQRAGRLRVGQVQLLLQLQLLACRPGQEWRWGAGPGDLGARRWPQPHQGQCRACQGMSRRAAGLA